MTLEELTPWLFSRTAGGIKWGLETTETLLAGVGDPHRRFRSLHIAGTNGKGSVASLCDAALRARPGSRVGLYTSPHLVSFAERIRIDGRPAPEAQIVDAAERLRPLIERTNATFFEATTAIAFVCFAEAGVETVVAEVGLGGRLDATNVLAPIAAAVTNISLEHTEHLGDTLEAIAREKAGIFKPGIPAVTAEQDPVALEVLRGRAAEVGAPLASLEERAEVEAVEVGLEGTSLRLRSRAWGAHWLRLRMVGEHQARNAALAAELLALLPAPLRPTWDEVAKGFADARWPGRLQVERRRGTTWILDAAHNPAGARVLAATLDRLDIPPPVVLVAGVLGDKDWHSLLSPLAARADAVVLTVPTDAPPARRWDPQAAAEQLGASGPSRPRVIPHLPSALERAETLAPHGTVLVTGSLFTVGEAMSVLGFPPD